MEILLQTQKRSQKKSTRILLLGKISRLTAPFGENSSSAESLEIHIRFSSNFVRYIHNSAIPESPKNDGEPIFHDAMRQLLCMHLRKRSVVSICANNRSHLFSMRDAPTSP